MTEEIIFKVGVNTGNTAKDLDNIDKELKSISNTAKDISSIDKRFDDLNKRVESGTMTMRESTRAIKEYQTIALQAGADSPVGAQAIANAAKLTDELGDLKNAITNASHDGANMQAALQLGSGVAAGYGVMQGTMALLGDESEDLQKTFVKLQAVQAVLTGIEQIRATLEKESFLMMKAKTIATKVQTGAEIVYAAAVGGTTGAMKALRLSMLAIPIVAIIAGIVALVAALVYFAKEEEKAEEMNNRLTTSYERQSEALGRSVAKQKNEIDNLIKIRTAQGASDEELHSLELQRIKDAEVARRQSIATEKGLIQQRAVAYYQARSEGNKDLQESIRQEMLQHQTKYKDLELLDGNYKASKITLDAEFKKKQAEKEDEAEKKQADASKAWAEKAKKKREEDEKLRLDRIKLMKDLMLASIEDEDLQKLMIMQEAHKREEEELIAKFGKDTELIKQLRIKQAQDVSDLNAEIALAAKTKQDEIDAKEAEAKKVKFDKDSLSKRSQIEGELISMQEDSDLKIEKQKELWALELEEELANKDLTEGEKFKIEETYKAKIVALDKETAEKQKQTQKETIDAGFQIAEQGMNAIQGLSDAIFAHKNKNLEKGSKAELENAKKQFKINKAMQLGGAVIDAAKGIMASLASSPVAIGPIPNPAGIASLAFVGIAAAANIAKIAAAKFEGGGGGNTSVAPPSIPSPAVAEPTLTGTAGLEGSGTESNTPKSTKIFVVDSEITSKQLDSKKAQNIATVE
jgi:hypothetical protein